jgi:chemotaxis protein methyltransferase CheR
MAELDLSPPVFSILSGLIEERVGLHYGLLDRDLLKEKSSARALDAGFESLLDYYYYLRYDPGGEDELTELVETLVVGETYFFREWPAVQVLFEHFIVPWIDAGRRPRIWSAACASGEEPLSLAMLLDARGLLGRVEIVATDISERALAKARSGRYGARSLRHTPDPHLVERYIHKHGDALAVPASLIQAIRWQRVNLLEDGEVVGLGAFDAILCRNVLIYFADETVRAVLERLSRSLSTEGVLLIGVSESLLRYGSGFVGEERSGAFVYRKAASR